MDLAIAPLPLDGSPSHGSCPESMRTAAGRREVHAGEVVIGEGRPSHSLYVVESGAVALTLTSRSGIRTIVGLLGPDDVFGVESLRERHPWSGVSIVETLRPECRALALCELLVFRHVDVARSQVFDTPEAVRWLTDSLSRRIIELQASLNRALSLPLAERALDLLGSLAARWGRPTSTGTRIDIPLTQDDLAAMLGATRESVNRAIRKLERRGAVGRSGRFYFLSSAGEARPGPGST